MAEVWKLGEEQEWQMCGCKRYFRIIYTNDDGGNIDEGL